MYFNQFEKGFYDLTGDGNEKINAKFNAALEANQYLRSINKDKYQQSILYFLFWYLTIHESK